MRRQGRKITIRGVTNADTNEKGILSAAFMLKRDRG
jgi:hypothetical protein